VACEVLLKKTLSCWREKSENLNRDKILIHAGRVVILAAAADGELDKLGLGHLEVIGTRFIDEHHEIHDYPGDKADDDHDDDHDHSSSSEDSDYHHAIYDHVDIDKDDYSDFGDGMTISTFRYRILDRD